MWYNAPGTETETDKGIFVGSRGRTSNVYEGKLNNKDSVVVKLAKEKNYSPCFEREKDVLINFNSPHIPSLLLYDKDSLVTTPLGTKVKNLQKRDVRNIIETLRMCNKNETGNFAGALECMPNDILQSLVNGEQILYSPSIDLICLVRLFYLMLHKPANVAMERISFDEISDFKSRAKNVLTFWSSRGKSDLWQKIYQMVKDLNYDDSIIELKGLFLIFDAK
ncbi:290_t:CDS:2 [Funneliformis geosporum]|uniref:290_t:CDS:1 n=1 Tax=Funneliformis geosporum TaxID=1117311 RepID=A0A9W4SVR9_9GLOM|nr:290_t:CDS:2 [Funneliformis geosporum]